MTDAVTASVSPLAPAQYWGWAVVAALIGVAGGRLLTSWVGGLLATGAFGAPTRARVVDLRRIELAAAVLAIGLWWWEVRSLGLGPEFTGAAAAMPPDRVLLLRWAAHGVLAWLLAAAAWIDLRHRVIPDCVTVPGVLAGLGCMWLLPDLLLPIACDELRSYAPPRPLPDVLAWWGGLRSETPPRWLGAWPHLGGLAMSASIFTGWWLFLTVPFLAPRRSAAETASWWRGIETRGLILPAGVAAIVAAWACGGDRFGSLQSGLVGLAVSAGLVWAVREGASRALSREAMGLGDVTLMAMVGAWIGWQAAVLAFFVAAFIGLAHGGLQLLRHRENELPYGPSLCLASAGVVVGWRPLWEWAGPAFAQPLELAVVIGAVVVLTAATLFVWSRIRG